MPEAGALSGPRICTLNASLEVAFLTRPNGPTERMALARGKSPAALAMLSVMATGM